MLDRKGPVPIYQQIAQLIHERVTRGELAIGDPVPSEASLEEEFQIARTTARRVARELRERGIAHTVRGQGTFIGTPASRRPHHRAARYLAISDEIAQAIKEGRLRPNHPIPSEKTLMRHYDVAKVTARKAVAHLRAQGWVFTVPHRGTYVSSPEKWPDDV
ncbi:GntR family transcriptional regulator [Nonomuraea muscovyensis]|uniref:GntR family transcriptional regulator n=1 Tax=Nonomuraea muscovyensis TaxID=1124761 RepID=UPI0033DE389E